MKIAINTIPLLSPLTGVGYYAYHISRTLRSIASCNEYTYYYGYYSSKLIPPGSHPKSFSLLKENLLRTPLLGPMARRLKDAAHRFSSRRFDVYFEPNFIPLKIPAERTIVTIPDFSFTREDWHLPEKVRYFQKNFWNKIKRADQIITISEFIRNEAIERFGFDPTRLAAIHLGYDRGIFKVYPDEDLQEIRLRYKLPENFILSVGSVEPRKNLKGLLQAYQCLKPALRKEFKIILVGFKGWQNQEILDLLARMAADVSYIGYVDEEDLARIYNLARLFVFPSFYEGFGLPPLEAMACGCPVVASRNASLPEVCGEAAQYVLPDEKESIAEGITRVLENETDRESMKAKGLERAVGFSWEKSAGAHLQLFEKLLAR